MAENRVAELLDQQVNKEFYSAYLYLDFANFYEEKGLKGYANWFRIQAQEERDHALLFMQYMQQNDMKVTLRAIQQPDKELHEILDPLKEALAHEQYVTSLINDIYAEAQAARDFRCMQFLDWFIKEQGEEEKTSSDLIGRFDLFGSDAKSLYALDAEMAARTYSAPSLVL